MALAEAVFGMWGHTVGAILWLYWECGAIILAAILWLYSECVTTILVDVKFNPLQ